MKRDYLVEGTVSSMVAISERAGTAGSCVLCGNTNGPIVFSEAGFHGRECSCGLVYIDPTPPPGCVDPTQDQHFDTYYSLPARVRLDWISSLQPSGSLLEVGCGAGQFLALARARGYRVAAVEPNPESARLARQLGIDVEQALIEESTLPPRSYDVVFHIDLLSHFPDPVRALRKMAELVKPGGIVCFEVGAAALARGWYPFVGRPGYPQHLWHFSERAIYVLLQRAGLQVDAVRRFGLLPATLLSAIGNRTLRRKISRPTSKAGQPMRARGFWRAYTWIHYLLRYRVGRFIPAFGPYTMFVAARPVNGVGSPQ
jgi:SAM-dependent methyltransferase